MLVNFNCFCCCCAAAAAVISGRFYNIGSTWHHYEDINLPERLVIMADSICSFNPVHGQGMTVAALEAVELDKLLTQRSSSSSSGGREIELQGLSNQWQQTAVPIVKVSGWHPWILWFIAVVDEDLLRVSYPMIGQFLSTRPRHDSGSIVPTALQ